MKFVFFFYILNKYEFPHMRFTHMRFTNTVIALFKIAGGPYSETKGTEIITRYDGRYTGSEARKG